eukprot:gene10577-10736_t
MAFGDHTSQSWVISGTTHCYGAQSCRDC